MTQNVALSYGDAAPEPFFDATQEMLSGAATLRLVKSAGNDTGLEVPAGTGHDQAAVSIQGRYRYNVATVTAAHPGGAAGTYDVYVTGTDTNFTPPSTDSTIYTFSLAIRATGSPPVTAISRKIGECGWDGTKLTWVRQLAGGRDDAAPVRPTAPRDNAVALRARRFSAAASAPIQQWEAQDGTVLASVGASGAFSVPGLFSSGQVTLTGTGKTALSFSDAGATGLTIGGDTNLYRVAPDTLASDDQVQSRRSVVTATAFSAFYTGGSDTTPRWSTTASGFMAWGPGTAADVALKREAAGLLAVRNAADTAYADLKADGLTADAVAAATVAATSGITIAGIAAVKTNDARLSDERDPVDASVTLAKLAAGATTRLLGAKQVENMTATGTNFAQGFDVAATMTFTHTGKDIVAVMIVPQLVVTGPVAGYSMQCGIVNTPSGGSGNYTPAAGVPGNLFSTHFSVGQVVTRAGLTGSHTWNVFLIMALTNPQTVATQGTGLFAIFEQS